MDTSMNDPSGAREIVVFPDPDRVAEEAAKRFVDQAKEAIGARETFRVALSGGNTPRGLYETLAADPFKDQVDWSRVHVFFSDERFVPLESPDSNYHAAHKSLLSKVPIPDRFIHRVATEDIEPGEAAALYEEGIRRIFDVGLAEVPRFDLVYLGLGTDGHTASLFPGTDALSNTQDLVAANFVPQQDAWRVTFTYPLINAGRCVTFLVEGESKAHRVADVLMSGEDLPAAHVKPQEGQQIWILDNAAAGLLQKESVGRRP